MAQTAVTSSVLMERAAGYVAQAAASSFSERTACSLPVCTGNNGGDGLAVMRLLAGEHPFFKGRVCLPGSLSPDAALQLEQLQAQAPQVTIWRLTGADLPLSQSASPACWTRGHRPIPASGGNGRQALPGRQRLL